MEGNAYALCPGTRGKQNQRQNLEHRCIGSTADNAEEKYCGDFAAFFTNANSNYIVDDVLLKSTFMIFYR